MVIKQEFDEIGYLLFSGIICGQTGFGGNRDSRFELT